MKHVSRVLFGFSIVAVLALFTACPQAADTNSTAPETPQLQLDEGKALSALASAINVTPDASTGYVVFGKTQADITIPAALTVESKNYDIASVTSSDTSVVVAKQQDKTFKLEIKKPAGDKAKELTLKIVVKGKDKDAAKQKTLIVNVLNGKGIDAKTYTAEELKKLAQDKKEVLKAAVVAALKVNKENKDAVKSNFTIGTINDPAFIGMTFTWSTDPSTNLSFNGADAAVTRPEANAQDASVKIKVALTSGSATSEAVEVITVKVAKKDAAPPQPGPGDTFTAELLLKQLHTLLQNGSIDGLAVEPTAETITLSKASVEVPADFGDGAVVKSITIPSGKTVTVAKNSAGDKWVFTVTQVPSQSTIEGVKVVVTVENKDLPAVAIKVVNNYVQAGGQTPDPAEEARKNAQKAHDALKAWDAPITFGGSETASTVKSNFTFKDPASANVPNADGVNWTDLTVTWSVTGVTDSDPEVVISGTNATVKRPETADKSGIKVQVAVASKSQNTVTIAAADSAVTLTVLAYTDQEAVDETKTAVTAAKDTIKNSVAAKLTGGLTAATAVTADWSDIDLSSYKKHGAELKWVWKSSGHDTALDVTTPSAVKLNREAADVTGKLFLRVERGTVTGEANDVEIADVTIKADPSKKVAALVEAAKPSFAFQFDNASEATTMTSAYDFGALLTPHDSIVTYSWAWEANEASNAGNGAIAVAVNTGASASTFTITQTGGSAPVPGKLFLTITGKDPDTALSQKVEISEVTIKN